jgi:hypothetical protein
MVDRAQELEPEEARRLGVQAMQEAALRLAREAVR